MKSETPERTRHRDDPPKDEEGLLLEYDVILCGTGLVQSILASALARAGKTVLHCDGADHYGELDTVWTLPSIQDAAATAATAITATTATSDTVTTNHETQILPLYDDGSRRSLRWHASTVSTDFPIVEHSKVETPYGEATVRHVAPANDNEGLRQVTVSLDEHKLLNGTTPLLHTCIVNERDATQQAKAASTTSNQPHIVSKRSIQARKFLSQPSARNFAIDASPVLIFAAGRAVQGMLASNVADYLEFKALQGLYWFDSNSKTKSHEMWRVPCSKGDIFNTKLLAPMDKRRLMKFIQLTMDYATSKDVQEEVCDDSQKETDDDDMNPAEANGVDTLPSEQVQSLNERHLNQGRSLARPQNKAVATDDLEKLQTLIAEGKLDLESYLTQQKLSTRLRGLVRYALAMETTQHSQSLLHGMNQLRYHIQSLGRYGTTAFLVPMYGSGELSQAFCRSAAVFGATYLLRRAPVAVVMRTADSVSTDGNDNDCKAARSRLMRRVHAVRILNDTFDAAAGEKVDVTAVGSKDIRCSHVIVDRATLAEESKRESSNTQRQLTLRRVSVLNGRLIESEDGEQRHLLIIPPGAVGNTYVIHCLLMDHSVQVSPYGCTVMHLTTTVDVAEDDTTTAANKTACQVLDQAAESLLEAGRRVSTGGDAADEIYKASFSFESTTAPTSAKTADTKSTRVVEEGLHQCFKHGQAVTADAAFEQAETIFRRICPGMEFLGLSEEMDSMVKERVGDRSINDDDERTMLDSAVGMVQGSATDEGSRDSGRGRADAAAPSCGRNGESDVSQPNDAVDDAPVVS